jgi:transcription antitermination factor NusG
LLADFGFLAWCPLQQEWRRAGPGFRVRKRKVARPAFVRYIFAGAPAEGRARWDAAFKARLIEAILARADGTPLLLNAATVARLAERQRSGEFDKALAAADPARGIEAGDRVRVVAGPFRGFEYRVEAVTPTAARVLAVLLGAERFVELALDAVEKAA